MPGNPAAALFLDRDGVINEEIGYLHRFEDVRFVPGAVDLIRAANTLGLPVIVVTNQAGIGRGLYTEQQFHTLMQGMGDALLQLGARLHQTYFSPFHPEHGVGSYRRDTECRKPRPGMLLEAARDHNLDLARSVMVGDRCTDMEAAAAAGVPHRFLLAGTEPAGCPGVPCTAVSDLPTITRWLTTHFSADETARQADHDAVSA